MDVFAGRFVWSLSRELANIRKHGIRFSEAAYAFRDPDCRILFDSKHSVKEQRYFCIGKVRGRILTVRFTYRGTKIRIFGAGEWRKGRGYYEKEKKF